MENGRKLKTIRNLYYAWISQLLITIMNFAVRAVFVRVLSKEYVGIGGLFGNIITMLSLAEMGVGSAIIYSLYEPLALKNEARICSLMKFYKQVYVVIGTLIAIIGILLIPFLPYLMKELPSISYLNFIYVLFVLNTSVSYFFSYKAALVTADQQDYLLKKCRIILTAVMYSAQILVLLITANYILYLIIQILFTLLQNFFYASIADRLYPFLAKQKAEKLDKELLNQIVKNTKALLLHKIGSVMVFATDNLLISKFSGLSVVAVYSNYTLIQQALYDILFQVFQAMVASVGNLGVVESNKRKYEVFQNIFFMNFWLYSFCSISFLCLAQDFIGIFFGANYVAEPIILWIIVLNFYLLGMRRSVLTFKEAFGLFRQNRYMPFLEALINFAASLVLVRYLGILGVLIGTTISTVLMPLWVEPWVLFRFGFQKRLYYYWKDYFKFLLTTLIASVLVWQICEMMQEVSLIVLVMKGFICLLLPNLLYYILFRNRREMKYYINLWKTVREKICI